MEKTANAMVTGFLSADGKKLINGKGDEIILTGWALGNWLVPEGYMWLSYNCSRFDRPRRIEGVIEELTGKAYAQRFWKIFRDRYITEMDIAYIAESGYNSVRIPINWRLFMSEEEEIDFLEEGFTYLEKCVDWCEKYNLYAFIDLHAAPGGQTGTNIDDSIDDVPRLFIDELQWEKAMRLWEKIATRYKDRWIVGGYDLLNEPIRPAHVDGRDYDDLLPKLIEFYNEAIERIRRIDQKHLISIEGHHWATKIDVFKKVHDDNMIIHLHRYGCLPDKSAFSEFLELSEALNKPLWLGETGENVNEWYSAIYPLAVSLGIGYNLWPLKKMSCSNSPLSIVEPKNWNQIIAYTNGGKHPGYKEARKILDELLEHIQISQCVKNESVNHAIFRQFEFSLRATDFDEIPNNESYPKSTEQVNQQKEAYRSNSNLTLIKRNKRLEKRFVFDSLWDDYVLRLHPGESCSYTLNEMSSNSLVKIDLVVLEAGILEVYQDDQLLGRIKVSKLNQDASISVGLNESKKSVLMLKNIEGVIDFECLSFSGSRK